MWQTHSAFTYKKDKCGIKISCNLLRNKKNSTVISTSPPKNTHTYRLSEHSESVSLRRERRSNTHTHTTLGVFKLDDVCRIESMLEGRQKAINVPSLMSPATAWFTSRMESWCAGRDEGQCSLSTPSPPSPLRNATQSPEIRHASQLQSHRKKKKKNRGHNWCPDYDRLFYSTSRHSCGESWRWGVLPLTCKCQNMEKMHPS